jgi:hypothetical protein
MGIINRTQDGSEQQEVWTIASAGSGLSLSVVNGSTWLAQLIVPRAVTIQSAQITALGVSGSPQALLGCLRFGTSASSFVIGTTTVIPAFGTSGFLPYSLGAAGGTVLNLQKGDILVMQQLGGTGAATTNTLMSIVVKNLQDIKSWY